MSPASYLTAPPRVATPIVAEEYPEGGFGCGPACRGSSVRSQRTAPRPCGRKNMKPTSRLVMILAVLVAFATVPSIASAGFSILKLRLGSTLGPENYLFTTGDTVYSSGKLDVGSHYRFVVSDSNAVVRSTSACTPSPSSGGVTGSFTVLSSSPLSNGTAWRYELQQFAAGCAGSPAKTASLYFDVARATAYADSTLTTPKSAYSAGQVAYVSVQGMGRVKGSATNPS